MKQASFFKSLPVFAAVLITSCSEAPEPSSGTLPSGEKVSMAETQSTVQSAPKDIGIADDVKPDTDMVAVMRSADSHTHGDAELAVVLENGTVTLEFESPLYNILGFEHAPETVAQKTTIGRAEEQLGRGAELFAFNDAANCNLTSGAQTVKLFEGERHDEHDEGHDDHELGTHKDVLLSYEFLCGNVSALSNVGINLFDFFEQLSEIDVTYLGPSAQRQVTLNRNNSQMDLSK